MSMSPFTNAGWIALVSTIVLASGTTVQSAAAAVEALAQGTPFADGTVEVGATKAGTCAACHGPNGNSTSAQWPKIAGQNATYTAEQLQLFKAGVRVNADMQKVANSLSDKELDSVAVYFQSQTPVGGEADPAMWQAGENLYRFGDPSRAIPACTACHGPVGRGNTVSDYPALRAQFAEYVTRQLTGFASGARYSGAKAGAPTSRNGEMMATIAKRLNSTDIADVAAYIQGMR
jgi:cytochrome c553